MVNPEPPGSGAANAWSVRLGAVYGPGLKFLGHFTSAAVLLYGASRVLSGQMTVGVLRLLGK